jgi:ribosomal protein S18 acetylase RimI-like enzyme
MRQAVQADTPTLAQLIRETGLDDTPDIEWIARVIGSTTRATLLETADDGAPIGFVDAFMTVSAEGVPRWEVDLIGVHPGYRGRGVAQRLIAASVEAGRGQGAQGLRALIHVDNGASAGAFRRVGFVPVISAHELYVSDTPLDTTPTTLACPAHLIPVCTLTYSGVWIENDHSPQSLRSALAIRAKYGWFIAGVLLPTGSPKPEAFARVGEYRWWTLYWQW